MATPGRRFGRDGKSARRTMLENVDFFCNAALETLKNMIEAISKAGENR
jgi:hypothetical protein